jgi:hypothetical protein
MSTATTQPEAKGFSGHRFDESVRLDDPKPFMEWEPSPRQIAEWASIIRAENEERKREERLGRLNPAEVEVDIPDASDDETTQLEDIDHE